MMLIVFLAYFIYYIYIIIFIDHLSSNFNLNLVDVADGQRSDCSWTCRGSSLYAAKT